MATKKRSSGRLSSFFSALSTVETSVAPAASASDSQLDLRSARTPAIFSPSIAAPSGRVTRNASPADDSRSRPVSLALPSRRPLPHAGTEGLTIQPPRSVSENHRSYTVSPASSRPASLSGSEGRSRPTTPILQVLIPSSQSTIEVTKGRVKRKSWLHKHKEDVQHEAAKPSAWVLGHALALSYDPSSLVKAEKILELWDDTGDTLVYLFPRASDKGPSFRVHSSCFSASAVLRDLAQDSIVAVASEREADEPIHLHLPITLSTDGAVPLGTGYELEYSPSDIDHLIAVRNAFSFLVGGSLVATERRPSTFLVFLQIAEILRHFNFTNLDGSTFGKTAHSSFENYVEELQIGDVRVSREKTIEAIVLGERMRSVSLYNEGFTHGVGKYDEIRSLKNNKYKMLSPVTQSRMERASLDLGIRRQNIGTRLQEFEFAAIFSGIMNSRTDDARKLVSFETWKASFSATRRFFVGYYKNKYGSWPPKASSKKNTLETNGLNRLVLRDLYHDLATVYDLLVDRQSPTTRGLDGHHEEEVAKNRAFSIVLRRVLHEYDSSTPPVQPAVPYDVPLLFDLSTVRQDHGVDATKDAKARAKKLHDDELITLLKKSINQESNISTPFLDAFKDFEHESLRGKSVDEICNMRCGEWLFLYAVLQALPMLVVDAPGVRWTRGVEYFLCEAPRSGVPWALEVGGLQRSWYGVAGGGVVSLPSDVIEHGVEGVYRRSHCWKMAAEWSGDVSMVTTDVHDTTSESVPARPGLLSVETSLRSGSENGVRSKRSSVANFGLEALWVPSGAASPTPSILLNASTPVVDSSKTFDMILGPAAHQKARKKKT